MSSDGPKNSQGYIRNLAAAGMTNEPYFEQLLSYTGGEWTEQVAAAWIGHYSEVVARTLNCPLGLRRKIIEHEAAYEYMVPMRNDPSCPPALREKIDQHLRWQDRSTTRDRESAPPYDEQR